MAVRDFIVHEEHTQLDRKLTFPVSGGKVGDPGLVGDRPCILYTDQDAAGMATVKFLGTFRFSAHAVTAAANSAIAVNDVLYLDQAPGANNPVINKDATNGKRFGMAVEALAAGEQAVIVVDLHA